MNHHFKLATKAKQKAFPSIQSKLQCQVSIYLYLWTKKMVILDI